jgi:hypothetical protein
MNDLPEHFKPLFNSDWNKGNNSTMTSLERARMHDLYLEYNKWQIKMAMLKTLKLPTDETVQGFPRETD